MNLKSRSVIAASGEAIDQLSPISWPTMHQVFVGARSGGSDSGTATVALG